MGAPRKPPEQRRRRNKVEEIVVDGTVVAMPEQPEWSRINVWAVKAWEQLWHSPVAYLWNWDADQQGLARLAMMQGDVATGLSDRTIKLITLIQNAEDRFFLNARSRHLAGIVIPDDKPEVVDKPATSERRQRLKVV